MCVYICVCMYVCLSYIDIHILCYYPRGYKGRRPRAKREEGSGAGEKVAFASRVIRINIVLLRHVTIHATTSQYFNFPVYNTTTYMHTQQTYTILI